MSSSVSLHAGAAAGVWRPHSCSPLGAPHWLFVGGFRQFEASVGGGVWRLPGLGMACRSGQRGPGFDTDGHLCRLASANNPDEDFRSDQISDKNGLREALVMTFHRTLRSRRHPKSSQWVVGSAPTSEEVACRTRWSDRKFMVTLSGVFQLPSHSRYFI